MQAGNYVSIWKVTKSDRGNWYEVSLTCQKKNKQTDKYETNFRDGYVHFVGAAADAVAPYNGQEGSGRPILRGKVNSFDVANCYVDRDGKEKFNKNPRYSVFDFEAETNNNSTPTQSRPSANSFMNVPDTDSEELPFA